MRADEDVAVYPVIAEPPVALVVKGTDTTPDAPPVAVPMVGACGTVVAVILLDAAEAGLVPTALVAVTVNVYAVPEARPVTVNGDEAPDAVNPPALDVTV